VSVVKKKRQKMKDGNSRQMSKSMSVPHPTPIAKRKLALSDKKSNIISYSLVYFTS
jgi:hypothetical protein